MGGHLIERFCCFCKENDPHSESKSKIKGLAAKENFSDNPGQNKWQIFAIFEKHRSHHK